MNTRVALMTGLSLLLTACGMKGDLYSPPPASDEPADTPVAPATGENGAVTDPPASSPASAPASAPPSDEGPETTSGAAGTLPGEENKNGRKRIPPPPDPASSQ